MSNSSNGQEFVQTPEQPISQVDLEGETPAGHNLSIGISGPTSGA
jgi:hypothetical protein